MLGAREIEVIMLVRVRLYLNACVSHRRCESWQLCQRWALVLFDAILLFQFISCASLSFVLSPPPFHPFLPSSIPFSLFSFFSPLYPSPPLLFPKVPGAGRDRRVGWWSTTTTRVFPLHHKPATGQQNMYKY